MLRILWKIRTLSVQDDHILLPCHLSLWLFLKVEVVSCLSCVEPGACRWLPESTDLFWKLWSPCIVRVVNGLLFCNLLWILLVSFSPGASLLGDSEAGSDWRTELRLCPVSGSSFHCWFLRPSVNSRIFGPKHIWMLIRARLRSNFGKNLFSLGGNSSTGYKVTQERQMD